MTTGLIAISFVGMTMQSAASAQSLLSGGGPPVSSAASPRSVVRVAVDQPLASLDLSAIADDGMIVRAEPKRIMALSRRVIDQLRNGSPVDLRVELTSDAIEDALAQAKLRATQPGNVQKRTTEDAVVSVAAFAAMTSEATDGFRQRHGVRLSATLAASPQRSLTTEQKSQQNVVDAFGGVELLSVQKSLPILLLRVLSLVQLDDILSNPSVMSVVEPFKFESATARSLPRVRQQVGSPYVPIAPSLGAGYSVAVLEVEGVANKNTDSVFGPCGSGDTSTLTATENPLPIDTCRVWIPKLDDKSVIDRYRPDYHFHAQNVVGIVSAVAPRVRVISLSATGGCAGCGDYFEDAIDWVVANAVGEKIVALNLSLGTNKYYGFWTFWTYSNRWAQLRALGVVPVASTMNQGFSDAMGYPASDPEVVSVAASYSSTFADIRNTYWPLGITSYFPLTPPWITISYAALHSPFAPCQDVDGQFAGDDYVTCFSNFPSTTTMIAPGSLITAGGELAVSGTSQAAPHVAGAIAALKSLGPDLTAQQLIDRVTNRGPLVTRANAGHSKRRLDLLAAASNTLTVYSKLNDNASGGVTISIDKPIRPQPEVALPATGGTLTTSTVNADAAASGWFMIGTQITATAPATDSAGGTFIDWYSCDSKNLVTRTCSVQMYGDHGITAAYSRPASSATYTISVNRTGQGTVVGSGNPINCGNTCSTQLSANTSTSLTATGSSGHSFSSWSNCPAPSGSNCSVTATANRAITANFVPLYRVDVFKNNPGTVTSALGSINCGGDCTSLYAPGTAMTLTATPASSFVSWAGCPTAPSGNSCSFNIAANAAITANFAPTSGVGQCLFTATPSAGNVSVGSGGGLFSATLFGPAGCPIVLTNSNSSACVVNAAAAMPVSGQTTLSFAMNSSTVARSCSVGVTGLAASWVLNQSAPVTQTYNVTTSVYTNGALSSAGGAVSGCSGATAVGTPCSMVATANAGYWFAGWADGGTVFSSSTVYSFTVTSPVNLTASFQPIVSYGNYTVSVSGPPEARMRPADGTGKWRKNGDVVRIQVGLPVGSQCSAVPNFTLVNVVPPNSTLAVAGGGTLQCIYSQTTPYFSPTLQQSVPPRISAGSHSSLARMANGGVLSWGLGQFGLNANSTGYYANDSTLPRLVDGVAGAVGVHSHPRSQFVHRALLSDGTIKSWGSNLTPMSLGTGVVVSGGLAYSNLPTLSSAFGADNTRLIGGYELVAMKSSGEIRRTEINSIAADFSPLSAPSNAVAISSNGAAAYALDREGRVWNVYTNNSPVNSFAIGISSYAGPQSGFDVFSVYEERPAVLPGLARIRAIASAERASFALRDDNTLWVWGQSNAALLAGATYPRIAHPQNDPVQITSLPGGIVGIAAGGTGEGFALAIDAAGNVWSWGENSAGQLGRAASSPSSAPGLVAGLSNVVEVVVGDAHAFAIQADGSVWAWGNNANGQLGDGTKTSRSTPQKVLCPSGFVGYLNLNTDACVQRATNTLRITNHASNPVISSLVVNVNGVATDLVSSGSYQGTFPSDSTVTLDIAAPLNYGGYGWSGDLDTTNTYATRIVVPMNRDWDLSPRVAACRYTHANDTIQNNVSAQGITGFVPTLRPVVSTPAQVQAYANCQWEGVASAPWLRSVPRTGQGAVSATSLGVAFTVDPNPLTTSRTGTIQIGDATNGVTYSFTQLGAAASAVVSPFGFSSVINAAPGVVAYSNTILPAGFNVPVTAIVTGGEMSVEGGPYTAGSATINPGDTVTVRTTASAVADTTRQVDVSIATTTSSPSFRVTTKLPFCNLDVDNDSAILPAKDGLIWLRALLGLKGDALTAGITFGNPSTTSNSVAAAVDASMSALDVDGDGAVTLTGDGLVLIRWLNGISGPALTQGVTFAPTAPRQDPATLANYLQRACN